MRATRDRVREIINCQGTRHIASPEHLIFFHPGEVHSGYASDRNPWTYRTIRPYARKKLKTKILRWLGKL